MRIPESVRNMAKRNPDLFADMDLRDMHDLYRYWNAAGELLYVGISLSAVTRAAQHKTTASWWDDWVMMTRERIEGRDAVLVAEALAIVNEKPKFNIAGTR